MRRITTSTADIDEHGEGKNGFTDGSAPAPPPTHLNADWFDNVQEEIARCVEGDGATVVADGDDPNYFQLDDAVQHGSDAMFPRSTNIRFAIEGFNIGTISGLDIGLEAGRMVFDGRKYYISAAKLIAAYPANDFRQLATFAGTATNGNYRTIFTGFGLGSPVTITTTRAAGVPADNNALAAQHATDITALIATTLAGVVQTATNPGGFPLVIIRVNGGLAAGTITHEAPSPGTLESEPFDLVYSLTDNRDHYFFIAPENPTTPGDPPERDTVWIERSDVATGAAAPATPSGTFLLAMVPTSGGAAGSESERNRGPVVAAGNSRGFRMKPLSTSVTAFVPFGTTATPDVDIGEDLPEGQTAPHNGGYVRNLYVENLHIRSSASSSHSRAYTEDFTFYNQVSAGATDDVVILDTTGWPDGSSFYIEAKGAAHDPTDPTDSFSFRTEAHVHIDGTPTLDGSGAAPAPFRDGNGGIAAGMDASFSISGANVRLTLAGHGTDVTEWFVKVFIIGTGDT